MFTPLWQRRSLTHRRVCPVPTALLPPVDHPPSDSGQRDVFRSSQPARPAARRSQVTCSAETPPERGIT